MPHSRGIGGGWRDIVSENSHWMVELAVWAEFAYTISGIEYAQRFSLLINQLRELDSSSVHQLNTDAMKEKTGNDKM